MSDEPFKPAQFGPYFLDELLAVGGMAEIFLARSRGPHGFEKVLVVKRILPDRADNPEFVDMFIDEAKVMMRLEHPRIVQVLDFGEVEGRYYIAMEYVRGTDCGQILRNCALRGTRPAPVIAVSVVADVLDALHFAHMLKDEQGDPLSIVHRDVSPSNVFISDLGDVKLCDFGIATIGTERGKNESGIVRGKYGYLAPEVVTGQKVDHRADVFSAGILLSELLMVQRLFYSPNYMEILIQVRDSDLERLNKYGRHIPSDLRQILDYALARNRNLRYQTAGAFRDALYHYLYNQKQMLPSATLRIFMKRLYEPRPEKVLAEEAKPREAEAVPAEAVPAEAVPAGAVEAGAEPAAAGEQVKHGKRRIVIAPPPDPEPVPAALSVSPGPAQTGAVEGAMEGEIEAIDPDGATPDAAKEFSSAPSPVSLPGAVEPSKTLPPAAQVAANQLATVGEGMPALPLADSEGDLARRSLVSIIFPLAVNAETGLLVLKQNDAVKEIYLKDGDPDFVTSNLPEELFGQYLLSQGVLNKRELDQALATMPHYEGRLGETLVALKLLRPMQMLRLLTRQVRQKVLNAFTWQSGTFAYYPERTSDARSAPLGLDAFELIEAGVKEMPAGALDSYLLPLMNRRPCNVDPPPVPPEVFRVGPYPRRVFDRLDGRRSVTDLLSEYKGTDPPGALSRMIYLLLECGLASLEPEK